MGMDKFTISPRPLRVLFVSSEAFPLAKTGGLADVCGLASRSGEIARPPTGNMPKRARSAGAMAGAFEGRCHCA